MVIRVTRYIRITWSEVAIAAHVGMQRQIHSLKDGRKPAHGFVGDEWGIHIEGACAELAVAKFFNLYWEPRINTFRQPDIGDCIQVRRRSNSDYELLVRPKEKNEEFFVHVTGRAPLFAVHGWMTGEEAKSREERLKTHGDRPAAYFVDKNDLHPLEEMLEKIAVRNKPNQDRS